MKFHVIYLLFALSFLHPLQAQDRSGETPLFTVAFRTLALEKGDYSEIYVQSDEEAEPTPVFFNRYRRSGSVSYTGTSPMVFFRMDDASDPEMPPRKIPIAIFHISEATPSDDLLLLTRPNPSTEPNQPEFLISGMDDSRDAFPQNTVIFINLTSLDLIGLVNEKKANFPRGVSKPFPLTSTLKTSIVYGDKDKLHFLFDNSFKFQKNSRVILVLQPPKRKGSLRIRCRHIVDDSTPKPTPTLAPSAED